MKTSKIEKEVEKEYKHKGYKFIKNGFPDFIFYKEDNKNITDVQFVEVKLNYDSLLKNQIKFKKIIESLGFNYLLIRKLKDIKRLEGKTTMRMNESTKLKFRDKFKVYPSETDEEILIRLIKGEVMRK